MEKFNAVITDPVGLHARPASVTVAIATKFSSDLTIRSNGKSGNLKSIINVMALGIRKGDEFTISAQGDDEKEAIVEIKKTMEENGLI